MTLTIEALNVIARPQAVAIQSEKMAKLFLDWIASSRCFSQ
jgi:hypothetical protein